MRHLPELQDGVGSRVALSLSPAGAEKLLAGSGHTIAELLAKVEADQALPKFMLPAKLRAKAVFEEKLITSENVAGWKRGADPKLRGEYVGALGASGSSRQRLPRRDGQRLRRGFAD